MSEKKPKKRKKPKETLQADLSAQAEVIRSRGRRADPERTTLNIEDPKRKSGSEPPPDALGETLVERGLITRHQLFNALNESYARNCTLREALIALGAVDEASLVEEGL
jgi:hypothetical protein